MPRVKAKKRKGFFGKRPAEIARERHEAENRRHLQSGGPSWAEATSSADVEVKLQKVQDKSLEKIKNSDFVAMEDEVGILTREKARTLGRPT